MELWLSVENDNFDEIVRQIAEGIRLRVLYQLSKNFDSLIAQFYMLFNDYVIMYTKAIRIRKLRKNRMNICVKYMKFVMI